MALFVGYYVLAIVMAGALCLVPYAGIRLNLPSNFYVGILYLACIGAASLILWSVIPRPERFKPPGPLLTPASDPRLFEEIDRVARETNQKAPAEAYLTLGVDAWVYGRGGFMGFGSKRIAGVGLALLGTLSVGELRAVLAHELGHFRRGDIRLGPWIFKTRSTIGRTLEHLPRLAQFKWIEGFVSLIQQPFVLYAKWFMRVTQAVSRHQEYLADEAAASIAGRETTISALRGTYLADIALSAYWHNLLTRVLGAGFLPPVAAGLGSFAKGELSKAHLSQALTEIEKRSSEPHDSHPSLGERIKALEALPERGVLEASPPAVSLLEDVPARERELFTFLDPVNGPKLRPIAWENVTAAVHVPYWAAHATTFQADLAGVTPKDLPEKLPELAEKIRTRLVSLGQGLVEEAARPFAAYVVGTAILTKMIGQGWQASCTVDGPAVLSMGERSWEPIAKALALVSGEISVEDWRKLCDGMGVADLELGSGEAGQAPVAEPRTEREAPPVETAEDVRTLKLHRAKVLATLVLAGILAVVGAVMVIDIVLTSQPPIDFADQTSYVPPQTSSGGYRSSAPGTASPFSLAQGSPYLVAEVTRWTAGQASCEATGTIVNKSAKAFQFVMVKVEFLDGAGRVVASLLTEARRDELVLPNGMRFFTVKGAGRRDVRSARAFVVYSVEVK